MNNKVWGVIAIVLLFSGFATGYLWQNGATFHHSNPHTEANVFVFMETPAFTGEVPVHNTVTNIGEQYDRDLLGYQNVTTYNSTSVICLGNTTTVAQTLTALTTEATTGGFARQNGTITGGRAADGDAYYNATCMFTSTLDMNINSTGLCWSNTTNNVALFAVASLGAAYSFPSGSNCTITWQITCEID